VLRRTASGYDNCGYALRMAVSEMTS
jgi:hypothetical protein